MTPWGVRIETPSKRRREFWSGLDSGVGEILGHIPGSRDISRIQLRPLGGFYTVGVPSGFSSEAYANEDGSTVGMWEVGRAQRWALGSLIGSLHDVTGAPIVVRRVQKALQFNGGAYNGPSNTAWLRAQDIPVDSFYNTFALENCTEENHGRIIGARINHAWNLYQASL